MHIWNLQESLFVERAPCRVGSPIGFVMGFMTVFAVLHCSHCACLQRSFSICRRIQHVIGTVANEATNDMGFGYWS